MRTSAATPRPSCATTRWRAVPSPARPAWGRPRCGSRRCCRQGRETLGGVNWTDPATIGYPALFGGVLLGSIIPIVPTGAVVSAAAAVAASTGQMSLPLVILLATIGGYLGDVVTFGVPRLGSAAAYRWISRRPPAERLE